MNKLHGEELMRSLDDAFGQIVDHAKLNELSTDEKKIEAFNELSKDFAAKHQAEIKELDEAGLLSESIEDISKDDLARVTGGVVQPNSNVDLISTYPYGGPQHFNFGKYMKKKK